MWWSNNSRGRAWLGPCSFAASAQHSNGAGHSCLNDNVHALHGRDRSMSTENGKRVRSETPSTLIAFVQFWCTVDSDSHGARIAGREKRTGTARGEPLRAVLAVL